MNTITPTCKRLDNAINFVASTMGPFDRNSLEAVSVLLKAKEAVAHADINEQYRPLAQADGDPGWEL